MGDTWADVRIPPEESAKEWDVVSKGRLIELVYRALPYSEQITDLDIDSEPEAITFTWRSDTYRVDLNMSVSEKDDHFVRGTNQAILLERVLQQAWLAKGGGA